MIRNNGAELFVGHNTSNDLYTYAIDQGPGPGAGTLTALGAPVPVGGNPLALKLLVSLAAVQPLPQILAELVASQPGPVEVRA